MNSTELSNYISTSIQQFLQSDYTKGSYRQIPIRVEDEQYFVRKISQYAIYNGEIYALCEAQEVTQDEPQYFIVEVSNPDNLKPLYRCSEQATFIIHNNRENEIQDISVAIELVKKIVDTLENQLVKQLDTIVERAKATAKREVEENEKITEFLRSIIDEQELVFRLDGNQLVGPFIGKSIPALIDQYLGELKQILQPHELLSLNIPVISMKFTPQLASLYEKLSPNSQEYINNICRVSSQLYTNLFEIRKKAAVHD